MVFHVHAMRYVSFFAKRISPNTLNTYIAAIWFMTRCTRFLWMVNVNIVNTVGYDAARGKLSGVKWAVT